MENQNGNNSKHSVSRTEQCLPSISRTCTMEDEERERTLMETSDVYESEKWSAVQCEEEESKPLTDTNVKDSDDSHETEKKDEKSQPLTRLQKLVFLGLAFVTTTDLMLYSVLAPFYPIEAKKKGVSTTVSGLVFGIYAIISFIFSPIIGKYVTTLGPRFLFFSGTFLSAGCTILFGLLDEIEDTNTFVIFCFILRSVESLGAAASVTADMTIVATVFPHDVAKMTGFLEMFSGLGLMLGPAVGGVLYKLGGYKLPFLVLGGLDMLVLVLTMMIIPDLSGAHDNSKPGSLLNFMKIPVMWPMCIGLIISATVMTFLDPTLTLHLEAFGVTAPVAGVLFLLIGGLYAVTMPIFGYLADKKGRTRLMSILGFYLLGLSYMLLGPSPLLNLPNHLWIVILSLSLTGISIGCATMPIFLDMMVSARFYGFPDDMSTNGLVSGVFGGCFSLGSFLGPVVGGVLKDSVGFNWASTYVAACCFVYMIIMGAFCIWEYQWGKGRRKPWRYFGEPPKSADAPHESDPEAPAETNSTPSADSSVPSSISHQLSINTDIRVVSEYDNVNDYNVSVDPGLANGQISTHFSDTQPLIVNA